jgi:tRNA A37 threonylcarbamoyladenosine synthetase subunit TsaC/SUA5/YrdC
MLNEFVFLTQTDTTAGFVSQNADRLNEIKRRPPHKHYIRAVSDLATLKTFTRVPASHKSRIRRARKTTFIMPDGYSYRIITDSHHRLLLDRLGWVYTTSANLSGETYDESFANAAADVIISPLRYHETPSTILKLGLQRLKRIR